MDAFLKRISSRKFLTALAVEVSGIIVVFWPQTVGTAENTALKIAGLTAMLLAAIGYGVVEASVDKYTKT